MTSGDPADAGGLASGTDRPVRDGAPPNEDPAADPNDIGNDRAPRHEDVVGEAAGTSSAKDWEQFRAAQDELRGHAVGGTTVNVTVTGHQGRRISAHRISPELVGHPYVPASGIQQVKTVVVRSKIIAVRGPEGSGRSAALLHALTGGRRGITILRLDPSTDLVALAPAEFRDCHALIVEDLTEAQLAQLTGYEIDRLLSELGALWVGFTLSDHLTISSALRGVVVDIGVLPPTRKVFDEHFAAAQPSEDIRAALLDEPGIREQVDAELARPRLGRIADFARHLATFEAPFVDVADHVREFRELGGDERTLWFRRLPNLRAHCTALSLAVFNGSAREEVTAHADRLAERIAPTPENQKRAEAGDPFATDAGVAPTILRARVTREVDSFVEGDVTAAVMRYSDAEYPEWVLLHIWDHLDTARPAVVEWLRDLGHHGSDRVRERSAVAVGLLATRAFTVVLNSIIDDWVSAPALTTWRTAALALSEPARDDLLAPTVDRLLEGWMTGAVPTKRATAALVVGYTADPANFSASMLRLATLADVDSNTVARAVAVSLRDLVTARRGAMTGLVLHEVLGWMSERHARRQRRTGHLAFLMMSRVLGDPTSRFRDDPHPAVPTLLIAAQRDQPFAQQLSWAWHLGLSGDMHGGVRAALTEWAGIVEEHPSMLPILAWVLREASCEPRTATIIHRAARSWLPHVAPNTAVAVMERLTGVDSYE